MGKHRLLKYQMTPEQYAAKVEEQQGRCAICAIEPEARALAVDHNHTTGRVRGLLCHNCNVALGLFKEEPQFLKRAIAYLQEDRYGRR